MFCFVTGKINLVGQVNLYYYLHPTRGSGFSLKGCYIPLDLICTSLHCVSQVSEYLSCIYMYMYIH